MQLIKKSSKRLKGIEGRMYEVYEYALNNNIVTTDKEWCEKIGMVQQNFTRVKSGRGSYTIQQMIEACKLTGVSLDYVAGLSKTIKRNEAKLSAIQLIEEGLRQLKKGKS
jgi:hypothetical protein